MHPPRHLAEIYGERLLPQELYLYDSPRSGVRVDVVLGDWIEGATLHEAVSRGRTAGRRRNTVGATGRGVRPPGRKAYVGRLGTRRPQTRKYRRGFLGAAAPDRPRCHVPARIRRGGEPRTGYRGLPTPGTDDPRLQCLARRLPRGADLDSALHALALDPTLYVRYPDADGLLFSPQQIRTDEALREAIALFEREGLAVQYRIARLLYAPTPRLFGLPELSRRRPHALAGPRAAGEKAKRQPGIRAGTKAGTRTAAQRGIQPEIQGAARTSTQAEAQEV